MRFTIDLDYTPRCPQPGEPFTEESFRRRSAPFTFDLSEVGLVLVDLWNFGFDDAPVGPTLGPELSCERGLSHARRKREVIERVIAPAADALRAAGVQVFHASHDKFLEHFPQWQDSTTQAERDAFTAQRQAWEKAAAEPTAQPQAPPDQAGDPEAWPPASWVESWREQHRDRVFDNHWCATQSKEVYPQIRLAAPVQPREGDLLVATHEQFHRLLTQRRIHVLFYMGFETAECLQFAGYGIANMQRVGYLCAVVRDATATHESATTLPGLWKTAVCIEEIEARWGYSVLSAKLVESVRSAQRS